jgi:putative methionine-R-sulfoxide reductase with GAF domain
MHSPGARTAELNPEKSIFGRDRRRAVRHRANSPAYVDFNGSSQDRVLELSQILNISESGMCIQAPSPMKVDCLLPLCLDLSETHARIYTTGHVVWSETSGKTGVRFPDLPEASRLQLNRWLTANEKVVEITPVGDTPDDPLPKPEEIRHLSASGYMSLIAEWAEMRREAEFFGPDLDPALQLLARRALRLTWASGAAIALINKLNPSEMVCRARAGNDSPEVGAVLQANAGFSGECVRSGTILKCHDAATDTRVDRASCRALGIRSIVACPIKHSEKGSVIGILAVFSPEVAAFWEHDLMLLSRLAGIIATVVGRVERTRPEFLPSADSRLVIDSPVVDEPSLLANALVSFENQKREHRGQSPRKAFLLAIGAGALAGAILMARPWSDNSGPVTRSISAQAASKDDVYVVTDIKQVQQDAQIGDAAAQYSLGVHYAVGDQVSQDYREAMDWFRQSAEQGNVRARGKMAALFWAGRGVPRDYSKAYFWALLAQAGGDKDAEIFIADCAPHLSHTQIVAEQEQAERWLHAHNIGQPTSQASR